MIGIDWDNLGFDVTPTKSMFKATCHGKANWEYGELIPYGVIDVSMHRDDIAQRGVVTVQPTEVPFDVEGKTIILVDDVLFNGRTVRAALDATHHLGRPKCIQLAVLVDRGHRELPIKPDFIGKNIPTSQNERIEVSLTETGGHDTVSLIPLNTEE